MNDLIRKPENSDRNGQAGPIDQKETSAPTTKENVIAEQVQATEKISMDLLRVVAAKVGMDLLRVVAAKVVVGTIMRISAEEERAEEVRMSGK
ncbi:MAG: hypothetical protein LBT63_03475 [Holosporaceae bacterium]|nr:hypothetical protein [Holosporaceae bacterium]